MNDYLKFAAGAGLYGLWAALVFAGKTDPAPLVYAIGSGITAVIGYAGITKLQASQPAPQAQASNAAPTVQLR